MLSYGFYKILHFIGIFMTIGALSAMCIYVAGGGTKPQFASRKLVSAFHGIGLVLALIGGFGLLARLGVMHGALPGWVIAKLIVWVILGGMPALIWRKPGAAKPFWALVLLFAVLNAYFAVYKPF